MSIIQLRKNEWISHKVKSYAENLHINIITSINFFKHTNFYEYNTKKSYNSYKNFYVISFIEYEFYKLKKKLQ